MHNITSTFLLLILSTYLWTTAIAAPFSSVDDIRWVPVEDRASGSSDPRQPLTSDETTREDWVLDELVRHRKRGFSVLARWKPFNTLGRQRTSIRNVHGGTLLPGNEYDIVSAETRALYRPSGQPLRWG